MKLLDFPAAPNPRRVRIFLAEKGMQIPIEVVDVRSGAHRRPEFLRSKNSLGLLPVLELDDGSTICESVAICRYLEAIQPEPPLMGMGPRDAALVEMWNRRMELELFRHVGDYFRNTASFFANEYVQSEAVGEDVRRIARERLAWLDEALADRPFVAGDRFTIADITALVAVDLGTPSVFEIESGQKNLARWHAVVSQRVEA